MSKSAFSLGLILSLGRVVAGALPVARLVAVCAPVALSACTVDSKQSAEKAMEHVTFVAPAVAKDVAEIRGALKLGEPQLQVLWKDGKDASLDPEAALDALNAARN